MGGYSAETKLTQKPKKKCLYGSQGIWIWQPNSPSGSCWWVPGLIISLGPPSTLSARRGLSYYTSRGRPLFLAQIDWTTCIECFSYLLDIFDYIHDQRSTKHTWKFIMVGKVTFLMLSVSKWQPCWLPFWFLENSYEPILLFGPHFGMLRL